MWVCFMKGEITMKAFFEEYGLAIIIAIVILLLVIMASPVGKAIAGALDTAVESLGNTSSQAQSAASGKISADMFD